MNQKNKILIVEDDEVLTSVYVARLEMEGFNVKTVSNGEDALLAIQKHRPDLILLDIMMPKISGFDVLDIVRNTPAIANSYIVMITALGQDKDKEKAMAIGADDYLVKSEVPIGELVEKIKKYLNQ